MGSAAVVVIAGALAIPLAEMVFTMDFIMGSRVETLHSCAPPPPLSALLLPLVLFR